MNFLEGVWDKLLPNLDQRTELPTPSDSYSRTPQETTLETRERQSSKPLNNGINQVTFVELKDDGSGVFKPKSGECENLRDSVEAGSYYRRERAAYLVDRFLGFKLVPPTVIREIDGELGSLQEFIPDTKPAGGISWEEQTELVDNGEVAKLQILDYIIYSSDRHWGNLLVKDKKIYAIDNGLTFGDDGFKHYGYSFAREEVPDEVVGKIKRFLAWPEGQEILRNLLLEQLPEPEVATCFTRIRLVDRLLDSGQGFNEVMLKFNSILQYNKADGEYTKHL